MQIYDLLKIILNNDLNSLCSNLLELRELVWTPNGVSNSTSYALYTISLVQLHKVEITVHM